MKLAAIPIPQIVLWPTSEYRPMPSASAPPTIMTLNKTFLSHVGSFGLPSEIRPRRMSK